MSSITTDIHKRLDTITQSLETVKSTITEVMKDINESLSNIFQKTNELIAQGEMTKDITLESFVNTSNNLIKEIKSIHNEQIKELQDIETQKLIKTLNTTANLLETRMNDIQIAIFINGIHALICGIKSGKVFGIPVSMKGVPIQGAIEPETPKPYLTKSISTISLTKEPIQENQKPFFGKGARKKTVDDIIEEKRKRDKIFSKYR